MDFTSLLIQRLRAEGVVVHDIRHLLPRNGTWMTRPLSAIKGISDHWDAEYRPKAYDSVARYQGQARYHINKDWGGGARGDGLQYHGKVDNVGDYFVCRNFVDVLWNVGQMNYSYIATCYDGTTGQAPTREQIITMQKVHKVLTTKCPEFPASQPDVRGHQEVPYNSTACNGTFLPETRNFRNTGATNAAAYVWDYPPDVPVPNPTPTPAPTPTPTVPEWKRNLKQLPLIQKLEAIHPTNLYDLEKSPATLTSTHYPAGKVFEDIKGETSVAGEAYFITAYSFDRGLARGIPAKHLRGWVEPTPPPQPEPTPEPTPDPEPTPTPTPPPSRDDQQDAEIGQIKGVLGGLLDLLKSIGQAIVDFVTKQKR